MERKKSNGFVGGIGFVLAAAGSSIGLGNLWSFPYKTSVNGGAAFVFVYVVSVLVFGVIVMIAETYLGKRAQANPVTAYKKVHPHLGWLGLFSIIVPFLILCYYSVLGGYTVKYAMNSFAGNSDVLSAFAGNIGEVILYTAVFLILAVIVVMAGVKNGIEKASKVLMPILFLILLAVVVYCLCLGKGVGAGLNYYLNPDFQSLGFSGVLAGMSQAFFSMSLGMGIMVSYGSYTGKEVDVGKSALWIAFFDTLVALLAGLAIFPAIYHYQAETGVELWTNGIVLLFSSLPIVFETLGVVGKVVSFLFFGMVTIAALTSVISLLEVVTQFIIQKHSLDRKKAIAIVGSVVFAVSVPIGISLGYSLVGKPGMTIAGVSWLEFFDLVSNVVLMPVCALGSCLALGWFAFKGRTRADLFKVSYLRTCLEEDGLKLGKFGGFFAFMLKYVSPILILVIEIFGVIDVLFPEGADGERAFSTESLAVVLTAYGILLLAIAAYYLFLRNKDTGTNADEPDRVASEE